MRWEARERTRSSWEGVMGNNILVSRLRLGLEMGLGRSVCAALLGFFGGFEDDGWSLRPEDMAVNQIKIKGTLHSTQQRQGTARRLLVFRCRHRFFLS